MTRCVNTGSYQIGTNTVSILFICYKGDKVYRVLARKKGTGATMQAWEITFDNRSEIIYVPKHARASSYLRERIESILS